MQSATFPLHNLHITIVQCHSKLLWQTLEGNEVDKATKEQDVKYKTKKATDLDKANADASSDQAGVQAELDPAMERLGMLKKLYLVTKGALGAHTE